MMDLRIAKTHKTIREAFIALLQEKSFDSITVQEILDKAMVNRATFYKYYSGKSDLAGQMIEDFKKELNKLLMDRLKTDEKMLQIIIHNHAQNLFDRREQMLALWKIHSKRHDLYQDMFDMSKQNFIDLANKQNLQSEISPEALDYQATMIATLFMASFKYYFEKDMPISKDLISHWQKMVDIIKL